MIGGRCRSTSSRQIFRSTAVMYVQTGAKRLLEVAESTESTVESVWQEVSGSEAVKSVGGIWESAVGKIDVSEVLGTKKVRTQGDKSFNGY